MATAPTSGESLAVSSWSEEGDGGSGRFIAERLRATGSEYKAAVVTTFVLASVVAALGWLACGVLLEHWVVPGGLPSWARWAWLLGGLVALATAAVRWLLPLVRYRVNLVYAAREIERDHPELHNDLVNTVLVKAHPELAAKRVTRSLQRRSASQLAHVPREGVIDRTGAVRLALALGAVVVSLVGYELFAPKSFMRSAARLIAPWSRIAPPSRVTIEPPRFAWRQPGDGLAGEKVVDGLEGNEPGRRIEVSGGTVTVVRGRQLVVSAAVQGLSSQEKPEIVVTRLTVDGGVDPVARSWRVPMVPMRGDGADGRRYAVVLPDPARGLDQPLEISIVAGDARTHPVRVAVVDTPALLVREVRYEFPPYTGRPPETVEWQGDVRALEGTKVTIVAEANGPLESAWIDLGCDGSKDRELRVGHHDLTRATGDFPLRLRPDRSGPEYASYRLIFRPRVAANASREPPITEKLEHRIEVVADLAPEVFIDEPREAFSTVPPDAPVTIRVRALDPDYALARVDVETRLRGGESRPPISLLGRPQSGTFRGVARLVPADHGAVAGSVLQYRAVATDNRPGEPNVATSPWQELRIDPGAPPRPPDPVSEPPAEGGRAGDRDDRGDRGDRGEATSDRAGGSIGDGERETRSQDRTEDRRNDDQQSEQAPQDRSQQDRSQQRQPQGDQPGSSPENGEGGSEGEQAEGGEEGGRGQGQGSQAAERRGDRGQDAGGEAGEAEGARSEGARSEGARSEGARSEGAEPGANGAKPGGESAGDPGGRGPTETDRDEGRDGVGERAAHDHADGHGDGRRNRHDGSKPSGPGRDDTVAADGTDDGEAMERILEHRRRQNDDEDAPSRDSGPSGREDPRATADPPGGDRGPEKPGDGEHSGQQRQPGDPTSESERGSNRDGDPSSTDPTDREEQSGSESSKTGQRGQEQEADGRDGQDRDGQGRDGQGRDGQGRDGQGRDGQGRDGQGRDGQGESGPSTGDPADVAGDRRGDEAGGRGPTETGEPGSGQHGPGEPNADETGDETGAGEPGPGGPEAGENRSTGQGPAEPGGRPSRPSTLNDSESADDGPPATTRGQDSDRRGSAEDGAREAGNDAREPGMEGRPGGPAGRRLGQEGSEGSDALTPDGSSAGPGAGRDTGGGERRTADGPDDDVPATRRDLEWSDEDLAHARNAADLAIEHLRDSLDAGRTDVLDELGWTPEQARGFLERWETMRQQAGSPTPRARREFERALRSLGLRPDGAASTRSVPADARGGQAEGRRGRPPKSYREQFEAFLQGTLQGKAAE